MFGGSGAQELGYANAAIIIALMRNLIDRGILSKDQAAGILDDAVAILAPHGHVMSIAGAIRMIKSDVKAMISKDSVTLTR